MQNHYFTNFGLFHCEYILVFQPDVHLHNRHALVMLKLREHAKILVNSKIHFSATELVVVCVGFWRATSDNK